MRKDTRWNPLGTAPARWSLAHNWRTLIIRTTSQNRLAALAKLRAPSDAAKTLLVKRGYLRCLCLTVKSGVATRVPVVR